MPRKTEKFVEVPQGRLRPIIDVFAVALQCRVTPLLRGVVGVGKSTIARTIARQLQLESVIVYGQRMEAVDVRGLPIIVGSGDRPVTDNAPQWWVKLAREKPTFLFLDELDKATEDVRRALLEVLLEWRLDGEPFHPATVVAGAFNPPECGGRWELSEDVVNRVVMLDFVVDADSWVDGMVRGLFDFGQGDRQTIVIPRVDATKFNAALTKWRSLAAAFIKANPSALYLFPSDWSGEPFATPRSWVMAVRLLAGLESAGVGDDERQRLALTGTIGTIATDEFLTYVASQDIIPPEVLLTNPSELPTALHTLILSLINLVQHVAANPNEFDKVGGIVDVLENRQQFDICVDFLSWLQASLCDRIGDTKGKRLMRDLLKGRKVATFIVT